MKKTLFLLFFSVCANFSMAQEIAPKLKTLVIGQFDKPDERYAIEVAITDLFTKHGIPSIPSLNVIKQGSDPSILATDSLQKELKAMQINNRLKLDYNTIYDEKDTMGRRYRRQDAIGTPFCVGIDEQTLEDGSISVRHRDAMEQERMSVDDLEVLLGKALNMKHTLSALQTVEEIVA